MILTTDGDLANRLMHPSGEVIKRYHVTLKQPFPATRLRRLVKGLTFEGERLKVERAALDRAPVPTERPSTWTCTCTMARSARSGSLFAALGYIVLRLRRYQIGAVRLKGIPLRGAKQLASKEIEQLFRSPHTPQAQFQAAATHSSTLHEDLNSSPAPPPLAGALPFLPRP